MNTPQDQLAQLWQNNPKQHTDCCAIIENISVKDSSNETWNADVFITSQNVIIFPYATEAAALMPGWAVVPATLLGGIGARMGLFAASNTDKLNSLGTAAVARDWFWGASVDYRLRYHQCQMLPIIVRAQEIKDIHGGGDAQIKLSCTNQDIIIGATDGYTQTKLINFLQKFRGGNPVNSGGTKMVNLNFPPIGIVIEKLAMGEQQELCESDLFDRMAQHPDYVASFVTKLSRCNWRLGKVVDNAIMTQVRGKFSETYFKTQTLAKWLMRAMFSALVGVWIVGFVIAVFWVIWFLSPNNGLSDGKAHQASYGEQHVIIFLLYLLFLAAFSGFCSARFPLRFAKSIRVQCVVTIAVLASLPPILWGVLTHRTGTSTTETIGGIVMMECIFILGPIRQLGGEFLSNITKKLIASNNNKS